MARTLLLSLLALLLVACPTGNGDDDDSVAALDDDDATDPLPEPAELAELSDGECPDLTGSGVSTFSSAGLQRTVHVFLPDDVEEGMPVVFFWHALGTTPAQWIGWMDLDGLADDLGAVVFVPQSRESEMFEWDWVDGEDADGPLFDDLRTCAATELGADMSKVAVAGFSAGAVWTSWLTMHRADALATAFIMSGGLVINLPWEEPVHDLPVYMMSGGANDTWSFINFADATALMLDELLAADHFLVHCGHNEGHTPGPNARGMMEEWLEAHDFGRESPWASGDADVHEDLDDYCDIVTAE